jgi:SnoaL-like polyketide cyclase
MSIEENKALTRRFYEEVFNNKNMAGVDAFVAPNIIDHSLPPGAPGGIESVRQAITMLLTAFPDLTGKQFTMPGISLLCLESGMAVEAWIVQDQLSMLQQLGLAPAPAQAAS